MIHYFSLPDLSNCFLSLLRLIRRTWPVYLHEAEKDLKHDLQMSLWWGDNNGAIVKKRKHDSLKERKSLSQPDKFVDLHHTDKSISTADIFDICQWRRTREMAWFTMAVIVHSKGIEWVLLPQSSHKVPKDLGCTLRFYWDIIKCEWKSTDLYQVVVLGKMSRWVSHQYMTCVGHPSF